MHDVGRFAGVSQSTVSHVVNQTGKIPAETEARVLEAIRVLGYRPNETARTLRLQRSRTLGMVTDQIASSPFAGRILLGAEQLAWERGYLMLVVDSKRDPKVEVAAADAFLAREVDGMLFAAQSWREVDVPPAFLRKPSLLVNAWPSPKNGIPAIVPDETGGGRLAAQELLDWGHRRIAFLGGPAGHPARMEREAGFRIALADAGVPVDESLVLSGNWDITTGHQLTRHVLGLPERPTALVCGNDRMAAGAVLAALELGLRVPQDVSVVGYDDQEELADTFSPGLTTVGIPHFDMGRAAVGSLLKAFNTGDNPQGAVVPGTLIRRESVAAPCVL